MIIELLQQVGFSQYEAQAYVALLQEHPANGYELAKKSGIPRPNIYAVLQKLEERGVVLRMEARDGTRYMPLPPGDLISKLDHQYRGTLEAASAALSEVASPPTLEYTLNLQGYAALLDHARGMLETVQNHALLVLWPQESEMLSEALQKTRDRGVSMVTLCLNDCPHPCAHCQGSLFRYRLTPPDAARWLVLVRDGAEMLAGEIQPAAETLAVRTRQEMLVKLASGYIQNSIALARILASLGSRFGSVLDPQTLADLDTLQTQDRWFDVMRQWIRPKENQN